MLHRPPLETGPLQLDTAHSPSINTLSDRSIKEFFRGTVGFDFVRKSPSDFPFGFFGGGVEGGGGVGGREEDTRQDGVSHVLFIGLERFEFI